MYIFIKCGRTLLYCYFTIMAHAKELKDRLFISIDRDTIE